MSDRQQELRDKGAEFVEARAALARAAKYPVVLASRPGQQRLAALNIRANKLQSMISNVGKMVDGAGRWFRDTFSIELQTTVPLADTAIASTMQAAIAGMNYFLRDARQELAAIKNAQDQFDAAPDDKKEKLLGELQAAAEIIAVPKIGPKTGMLILAALGLLMWFNFQHGGES